MLKFIVIGNGAEERDGLAAEVRKASESMRQYSQIQKIDQESIPAVADWEGYDSIFLGVDGSRANPEDFRAAGYIRGKAPKPLMVFYSAGVTDEVARSLFEYHPVSYQQLPIDGRKLRETIRRVWERKKPARLFIEVGQECIVKDVSDILCFDALENVIYADDRIEVSNGDEEERRHMVGALKREGFFLVKGRYCVNRFWQGMDKLPMENTDV